MSRPLSYTQQQALKQVAYTGSVTVKHAHTNRRTTAKLKALGYIEFSDARGLFVLTAKGKALLSSSDTHK